MNETELSELLTPSGFFRFLAQQAKLDPEEAKRIYRLGTPWGLWPPDLDISHEAADTGVGLFTYLAALQPLIDMDTEGKEAQLTAYEAMPIGGETTQPFPAVRAYVKKVSALSGTDEAIICSLLHALYTYRQRVGQLSMQKISESSRHRMEQDQAAANLKLQRALVVETEQHNGLP
jgi:hypothetical protein